MPAVILALIGAAVLITCIVLSRRPGLDWDDFRPRTNEERLLAYYDRRAVHEAERIRLKARQALRVAHRLDQRAASRVRN